MNSVVPDCTASRASGSRKKRTVIVYFGVLVQYFEIVGDRIRYILVVAAAMAKATVEHKEGCTCSKGYTRHRKRRRTPRDFRGGSCDVPVWQIRCKECKAVFTVLPSFLARYQRWDVDALGRILEINLVMTSSYRHTLKILECAQGETLPWNPGSMLRIVHWLADLAPLPSILLTLGIAPPPAIIEDEKFVRENGVETYVTFVSCREVIWWVEYLPSTDEASLEASFRAYVANVRELHPAYNIEGATYDGWKPAKEALEAVNPKVVLQECHFHAQKRMSKALPLIRNEDPSLDEEQLKEIRKRHDRVLEAQSSASYSQRLRRFKETYGEFAEVVKRCRSLKKKARFFLAYLLHPLLCLAKVCTSLDQLIKFFDRKFLIMQTFRASQSASKTVRAFAIVRNFWRYMPGAKRSGLSPVELAGADLCGIPWLEVVNLASTSRMTPEDHVRIFRARDA